MTVRKRAAVRVPHPEEAAASKTQLAAMICDGAVTASAVVDAFSANVLPVDAVSAADAVRAISTAVRAGDLDHIEQMLVGQSIALQTLFASLSRRAAAQESLHLYETYMGIALKAQAQSRATIQALVDLKFPRSPATFVKQANIAHGPQQVNNGRCHSRVENARPEQSRVLEHNDGKCGSRLDTRATSQTAGADSHLAALGEIDRPAQRRRQGTRGEKR